MCVCVVQRGLQGHSVTFMRKRQSKRNRHMCVCVCVLMRNRSNITKARTNNCDTCVHVHILMSLHVSIAILAQGEPRFILSILIAICCHFVLSSVCAT